jgi:hypothetical protein
VSTSTARRPTGPAPAAGTATPRRRRRPSVWLVPVVALLLWVVSLASTQVTDQTELGPYGLVPVLPWTFWVGLGGALASAVVQTQQERLRHGLVLAHLGVVLLMLYATSPALEDVPRYTYTYKHIGITQYIERYGSVDKTIDIYHRWPGFFSLSAWFSQVAGLPDPTSYAAWAEVYFAGIDALLVWAVAQAVTRSVRLAWGATLLFTVSNWVGQDYYSPQAYGYVLMLGVSLCVLLGFQSSSGPLGRLVERLGCRVLRIRHVVHDTPTRLSGPLANRLPLLVLLFDAVLAASHQLTPYVLLLQLGGLAVLGLLRPSWVVVGAAVCTIGYLLPNFDYVVHTFGLLSAPDPLANATASTVRGAPTFEQNVIKGAALLALLLTFLLGAVGVVRRARRGYVRQALVVAVLAFVPPFTLVAQSYGGEARLRVLLYALPWCCAAAMWCWSPGGERRTGRGLVAPLTVTGAMAALFGVLFFGHEDYNLLSKGEVAAAAYVSDPDLVPPGSSVMVAAPNFPARYGPLYFRLNFDFPALSDEGFGERSLLFPSSADVDVAARILTAEGLEDQGRGYLVFSRGQEAWARDFQLYEPNALKAFEGAIARSPRFRLVYDQPTARVYELVR